MKLLGHLMRRCNQVFMDKQCPLINFGLILGMSTLLNSPNQGGHCEMGKVMNPSRKYCQRNNIECFNSTLTINNSKLKLLCYHSRFSSILAKKTNFRTGCESPHMKLNVQTIVWNHIPHLPQVVFSKPKITLAAVDSRKRLKPKVTHCQKEAFSGSK